MNRNKVPLFRLLLLHMPRGDMKYFVVQMASRVFVAHGLGAISERRA